MSQQGEVFAAPVYSNPERRSKAVRAARGMAGTRLLQFNLFLHRPALGTGPELSLGRGEIAHGIDQPTTRSCYFGNQLGRKAMALISGFHSGILTHEQLM